MVCNFIIGRPSSIYFGDLPSERKKTWVKVNILTCVKKRDSSCLQQVLSKVKPFRSVAAQQADGFGHGYPLRMGC